MSQKTALITGITGQDGSYLAEFLLSKGYRVVGLKRLASTNNFERISHLLDKIELVKGDLLDQGNLIDVLKAVKPHEVYNLAAQSFVPTSFTHPLMTAEYTAVGVTKVLEAIRQVNTDIRFYQASSSEMFGKVRTSPQNEDTPFYPRSPYGVAKVYGHFITVNYRESYKMYAVSGILFNHESPRRGMEFVTRKVSNGVAKIYLGLAKDLTMGNLEAKRDWGFAGDYVEAMWQMLQLDKPDDYAIGTCQTRSIKELLQAAFSSVDLDWEKYVKIDESFKRPAEVDQVVADTKKAQKAFGWKIKTPFEKMIQMMVERDIDLLKGLN